MSFENKNVHETKGTFYQYIEGRNISSNGKIRLKLDPGTYRLQIYPNGNSSDYTHTVTEDFTVESGAAVLTQTFELRTGRQTTEGSVELEEFKNKENIKDAENLKSF